MDKEYLLKKWLADELTEAEMETFKTLEEYPLHLKIIDSAKHFKAPDVTEVNDVAAVYKKFNEQYSKERKTSKGISYWLRIAALFVVALGVSLFYFTNNKTNIETLAAQQTTLELPDSSEVVLNSVSQLAFTKSSWDNKREVYLNGEAFFKVTKGSTFDVITETGKVRVVGTQFNVKRRNRYFEVQCFEGLVQVIYNNKIENIPAGNAIKLIDGTVAFETTDAIRPQWIDNISSFKSVPLYEVLQEFERQYDVTITANSIDQNRVFTGGFVHNNLEDGLKSITLPLDLRYRIDSTKHITLFTSQN